MGKLSLVGDIDVTLNSDWTYEQVVWLMGDLAIDASATTGSGKRHLDIVCAMGDVELTVPPGCGVDVWGPPIGRDTTLARAGDPEPVIRVRFVRLMGDLTIIEAA